jgi:hypothetical protein
VFKWCLGIFMAILLGLVAGIRAQGIGDVSVIDASVGPARVMRMVARNTLQRTPGTNATNGTNRKDATRTRAAGPCVDKAKRYVDCGMCMFI